MIHLANNRTVGKRVRIMEWRVWDLESDQKKVRKDVVENDCQTLQDKEDAMDRSNWRKLIKGTGQ